MIASRFAYQTGMHADLVALSAEGRLPRDLVERFCPACRCAVFVPGDSDRELVSCAGCSTELVTRCDLEGVDVFVRDDRNHLDGYDVPTETIEICGGL